MELYTERLWLRPWTENDAEILYNYAKDPAVGPMCGWPEHKNIEESLNVIKNVLNGKECYAICRKEDKTVIGTIELRLGENEGELGCWLGREFWGRGYMTEAARELLRRAFEELGMDIVWYNYHDGNNKSKRVQEKLGFVFHHTDTDYYLPLLDKRVTRHTNILTRERWLEQQTE